MAESGKTKERSEAVMAMPMVDEAIEHWRELVKKLKESGNEAAFARPGLERFEEGTCLIVSFISTLGC